MRRIWILAAIVWATPLAWSQDSNLIERDGESDVLIVDDTDAAMNDAMAAARETLPVFWDLFNANPDYQDAFNLKVGLPTTDGSLEHIWIDQLSYEGGSIKGVIANEPLELANGVQFGDVVEVTAAEVSDWTIWSEGKQYGGF
ncbi:MAG: DUF2314 domain-containing protein, partial [Pseudomonadota bacterium]